MKILAFLLPDDVRCTAQQLPALRRLRHALDVTINVIDPREQPELARQYNIPIVPTTVLLDEHDRVRAINKGFVSADTLRRQLGHV